MRNWLILLQCLFVLQLFGCGGGGGADSATNPSNPTPAAAFSTGELAGKSVYQATPPPNNISGTYNLLTFNADGTVTKALNLTSASLSSASAILTGTYAIDSNGIITITLPGKTPEKLWKVTSTLDGNNSYDVKSSYNTSLISKLFITQTNGAAQALAYATGAAIPASVETAANYVIATFAGSGVAGSTDSTGTAAKLNAPDGITSDGTNLYVSDYANHTIRKIVIATGVVSTLAGSAGVSGATDDVGTASRFNNPAGITCDGTKLYVADYGNHTIRMIDISTGSTSTIAGLQNNPGSIDGTFMGAQFNHPIDLTTDGTNLYVSDTNNHTIRKIVIATGVVTTLAGSAGISGAADGSGIAARFNKPGGITNDGTNLYVADWGNYTIRKIVIATGVVTTIAGQAGISGATNGIGATATFKSPNGLMYFGGMLYITEATASGNNTIRVMNLSTGAITTIAGVSGVSGSKDGDSSTALFNWPRGIALVGTTIYLTDKSNNLIRTISTTRGGFTAGDFSGRVYYSVDSTGKYRRVVFNPDGTVDMSALVSTGTPGAESPVGTWQVTNATLSVTMTSSGQTTTYTFLNDYNTQFLKYWRTQTQNNAKVGWCYDSDATKSLAQAMALGSYVQVGGAI